MRSMIIGTAGHVDHGKTSLVKALTGIDTDRLKEEKERGISIELGYAPLKISEDMTCGIVDVPGHERLVKTMMMGATQTDLVLFVIAANEGVKPQTEEHFNILKYLNVIHAICVLTKSDLVTQDVLTDVSEKVRDHFKGAFLDTAKIIAVSSQTGEGISELKSEISRLVQEISISSAYLERSKGPVRILIDRIFTLSGFGTVVTGPLLTGILEKEEELEVYPLNKIVRVRQIHAYGQSVDRVIAPSRVALNLRSIEREELQRGYVLGKPGIFSLASAILVQLREFNASVPRQCMFHAGTYKTLCQIRKLKEPDLYLLKLKESVCILKGDKFILRHGQTLAGGEVVDPFPFRKTITEKISKVQVVANAKNIEKMFQYFNDHEAQGLIQIEDAKLQLKLMPAEFDSALKSLLDQKRIIRLPKGFFIMHKHFEELKTKVCLFFKTHDSMTVSDVKALTQTSRKHAIPYLEFFDESKWTIRKGDVRVPWKI